MSLLKQFQEAATKREAVFIKNYFKTNLSWQEVLNFVYKQTIDKNEKLEEKVLRLSRDITAAGNVLVQDHLWLAPQTAFVWQDLPIIKDFLIKLNKDTDQPHDFTECFFYKALNDLRCDCNSLWHSEGIKVSLGNRIVGKHSDPWPACYLQSIGTSFWEITGNESTTTYELNEGDLLFFPKNTSHAVWAEGPRVGFLINSDINKDITKTLL